MIGLNGGKDVSDTIKSCDDCGTPMEEGMDERGPQDSPEVEEEQVVQKFYSHPYHALGGWCKWAVYGTLAGIGLQMIVAWGDLSEVFPYLGFIGAWNRFLLFFSLVGSGVSWFYSIKCCIALKNRNPLFLRLFEIGNLVGFSTALIVLIFTGFPLELSFFGSIASIALWVSYFTLSVRVRTYMGSDAYLKKSIFCKRVESPKPADE